MNRKQKKMLARILAAAAMLIALKLIPVTGVLQLALYLVAYLVIGYDILKKAWKSYMEMVQGGLEPKSFPYSENVVRAAYCTVTGDLAGPACPSATGYYTQDNMPAQCTAHG